MNDNWNILHVFVFSLLLAAPIPHGWGMKNSERYESLADVTQGLEIFLLSMFLGVLDTAHRKLGNVITHLDDACSVRKSKRQPPACDFLTQDFSILKKQ